MCGKILEFQVLPKEHNLVAKIMTHQTSIMEEFPVQFFENQIHCGNGCPAFTSLWSLCKFAVI